LRPFGQRADRRQRVRLRRQQLEKRASRQHSVLDMIMARRMQ
jgi:hypothetical protein